MIRLFVALGLPEALRDELSMMAGGIPGARWVPEENYHLTLRFIGEVPGWQAQEVDEALAGVRAPGFDLTLRGVGTFQKARSEEHTSELQSRQYLVCRLLLEKKKNPDTTTLS